MGKNKKKMMSYNDIISAQPFISQIDKPKIWAGKNIQDSMIVDIRESGVYMGLETDMGKGYYVGKHSNNDGNILTIGINGSGKSRFLVEPTLDTWRDPAVILDIKGELCEYYRFSRRFWAGKRPYIKFDPTNGGVHYDVYALLDRG